MHEGGVSVSYVLAIISVILFIIAVVFAVIYWSQANSSDDHHGRNVDKQDVREKLNTANLLFFASIGLTLLAIYSGGRTAGKYLSANSNMLNGVTGKV